MCILNFKLNYEKLIIETDNHRIVSCDKSSISEATNFHPSFALASFSLIVSQLTGWLLTLLQRTNSLSMCSIVTEVDCTDSNHTALRCSRLIFCVSFLFLSIISVSIFLSLFSITFLLLCLYIFLSFLSFHYVFVYITVFFFTLIHLPLFFVLFLQSLQ